MTTQAETATAPERTRPSRRVQQLRELYADAPEIGKTGAGERASRLTSQVAERRPGGERRPGRRRLGTVSS